jgi:hypothetical protein
MRQPLAENPYTQVPAMALSTTTPRTSAPVPKFISKQ